MLLGNNWTAVKKMNAGKHIYYRSPWVLYFYFSKNYKIGTSQE